MLFCGGNNDEYFLNRRIIPDSVVIEDEDSRNVAPAVEVNKRYRVI